MRERKAQRKYPNEEERDKNSGKHKREVKDNENRVKNSNIVLPGYKEEVRGNWKKAT